MKTTFYFYVLNDCSVPVKDDYGELEYIRDVKHALKNKNPLLLDKANICADISRNRRELFEIGNGIDVRSFRYTGEVKQTSEIQYEFIVQDDIRISQSFSEKTKRLLTEYGFKTDGWHWPFKIEASSEEEIYSLIEQKLGKPMKIIWSGWMDQPQPSFNH